MRRQISGYSPVWGVAYHPRGTRALCGSADGRVVVWDLETGASRDVARHSRAVRSVAFSQSGEGGLSASDDGTVRLWGDEGPGSLIGHDDAVWAVARHPTAPRALSASADQTLREWDLRTGSCQRILAGHRATIVSVSYAPDPAYAISTSGDGSARIWHLDSDACVRLLVGHEERVWAATWRRDGKQLLTASADGTVRIWNAPLWKCESVVDLRPPPPLSLNYHSPWITSVAYLPDPRYLLLGALDGTLQVWQIACQRRVRTLRAHTDGVLDLAMHPRGRWEVLSGSLDGQPLVWKVKTATSRALGVPSRGHRRSPRGPTERLPGAELISNLPVDQVKSQPSSRSGALARKL
jgi:WD40 repeat protein